MKRFELTVPKIHCEKKNDWLNKDKVYLACIVAAAKPNEQLRVAFAGLSPISQKLKKGDIIALDLKKQWFFEIQPDEVYTVSFGLYEYDNGDVYEAFENEVKEIVESGKIKWNQILMDIWDAIKAKFPNISIDDLVMVLPNVGITIFKELRKDDVLGKRDFTHTYNDDKYKFVPEFDLKDAGHHYKIQIKLDLV